MAIVEVVKYNGNPDVFAWKYPSEELGTWTQLIVNESKSALAKKAEMNILGYNYQQERSFDTLEGAAKTQAHPRQV